MENGDRHHQNEILRRVLKSSFLRRSSLGTAGDSALLIAVATTPHSIFTDCRGLFATVFKMETDNVRDLGSFCETCGNRFHLPFDVNRQDIGAIKEQTEFEARFRKGAGAIYKLSSLTED